MATDLPSAHRGNVVGIGLAIEPGKGVYVPLAHRYIGSPKQLSFQDVERVLVEIANGSDVETSNDLSRFGRASAIRT